VLPFADTAFPGQPRAQAQSLSGCQPGGPSASIPATWANQAVSRHTETAGSRAPCTSFNTADALLRSFSGTSLAMTSKTRSTWRCAAYFRPEGSMIIITGVSLELLREEQTRSGFPRPHFSQHEVGSSDGINSCCVPDVSSSKCSVIRSGQVQPWRQPWRLFGALHRRPKPDFGT
jgi:hypothetical protein